ncbi:TonB-dependent receptor [Methylosinus sp. Sm6]|uniref:TonB-dependent siderophore receptor n=1 Tax=Methylosinus sp. Sm6 TaxID=2866948 RepID=UPI0021032FCB|nr:TonB-dependent receptor [Methylosinus sp. Sm6]
MSEKEIAEIVRGYDIPAGPVSTALNRLADESGVRIVYDSRLTRFVRSRGLTGRHKLAEALAELLSGTGLHFELSANGKSALIVLAQAGDTRNDASAGGATPLPPIDIGHEQKENHGRGAGGSPQGPGDRYTGYKADSASSAMKMDTPLLKTPVAIQVVTRQTMDDQQAISVGDAIVVNVSGVQMTPNFYEAYKVRGFTNYASSYKNGLVEYRMRNLDTTNLQSIEVLKGPAAILYGRVEPGGLIDLVVKRPLETPYYSVQQQNGSFGMTRTTLDATGPLIADKSVLYRFNGEFYHSYSYRDFVKDQNVFLAPTLSFHPIEQFRLNIDFEYQHRTAVSDYPHLPAIGGYPAQIPISRYLQPPLLTTSSPVQFDKKRIAYDWTFAFDKNWSLTNRLSYMSSADSTTNSLALSVDQVTGDLRRSLTNTTSVGGGKEIDFATNVDLHGHFETGPLTHAALLGFDHLSTRMPMSNTIFRSLSSINIYAPNYWTLDNPLGAPLYVRQAQKWTGVYAQDLISFFDDSVHVLLGGRYDWAETSSNKNTSSYAGAMSTYTTDYNKAFSPRAGLVYQPLPWLSLYGNFTRSFGLNNTTSLGLPLPPQKGEQFEGGVKAELLDKRLIATFAFFDITKTNIATPDPANPLNTLVIGQARSQGVEIDLTGRIDDNWSVIANYTHDDVRTIQGAPSYNPSTLMTTQLAVAGYKLPASPRNYGNLWVKYEADGEFRGLSVGGGVSVVESSLGDNANSFILPGYTLLNGMIAYTTQIDRFTVTAQLNVKNATDTIYYPTSSNRTTIQTGAPRSVLGSLRVEF